MRTIVISRRTDKKLKRLVFINKYHSEVDKMRSLIKEKPSITLNELAEKVGFNYSKVFKAKELGVIDTCHHRRPLKKSINISSFIDLYNENEGDYHLIAADAGLKVHSIRHFVKSNFLKEKYPHKNFKYDEVL
jgi:hypothetical protein